MAGQYPGRPEGYTMTAVPDDSLPVTVTTGLHDCPVVTVMYKAIGVLNVPPVKSSTLESLVRVHLEKSALSAASSLRPQADKIRVIKIRVFI